MLKIIPALFLFSLSLLNAQNPKLEWAKGLEGTLSGDWTSITTDASGNVYTTGGFFGFTDFDPGAGTFNMIPAGGKDIFISKLDGAGNFLWAKRIGGIANEVGNSIAIDALGNVCITGYFSATVNFNPGSGPAYYLTNVNPDFPDVFILKLDASGKFLWAKQISSGFYISVQSITTDASNNVYTTGGFWDTADFNPGAGVHELVSDGMFDQFILKLNASGNFIWAKTMQGDYDNEGYSIVVDEYENVYTTGYFKGIVDFNPGNNTNKLTAFGSGFPKYQSDIFVSKLDISGNFVWAKQMGADFQDIGNSIAVDAGGNVYTTGKFEARGDFNPDPTKGPVFIAMGRQDIFISKLDPAGNFIWAKQIGGELYDEAYSLKTDASGNVYTIGTFEGKADFDPGADSFNLTANGYDVFISKLDASGKFKWAKKIGGTFFDFGTSIALDGKGNIYSTGDFSGTVDFDPDSARNFILTAQSNGDVFIHKMSEPISGLQTNATANFITIYPNPANGKFYIEDLGNKIISGIQVYNSVGALVYESKGILTGTIDLTSEPDGLYLVNVICENNLITTQKIIKQ